MEAKENLIKKTCQELGVTQKELAKITKFNEQTLRNWSSKGSMPEYSKTFLNLLIEHHKMKEAMEHFQMFNKYFEK